MKHKKLSFCLVLLASLALAALFAVANSSNQGVQSADAMLGQAIHLEEVKGDLEAAIDAYKRFLSQYGANEPLAATAQLHIGICYEKLGLREARIAYKTVIDKYPQQLEAVKEAKERISRLADTMETGANKPKFRKITIPFKLDSLIGASMSRDGRLAFSSEGSIWIIPVQGKVSPDIVGEPRRLTEAINAGDIFWSEDGSLIGFKTSSEDNTKDIYIIPSQGGEPTKFSSIKPPSRGKTSLSPDGGLIAFEDHVERQLGGIQTFARGATSSKVLTGTGSGDPAFSPDGQRIAYVSYSPMELRVIPANGGESIKVVDTPNRRIQSPVWSPDGHMLAFLTAGLYNYDEIWIVPISEKGQATATPTSFKLPNGTSRPLFGWTSENKIGLIGIGDSVDGAIYSVPASGGKSTQVTPSGYFFHPRWSPDGERIWFLNGDTHNMLGSVPSGGGTVSNLSTGFVQEGPPGGGNVISPDGKKVVFFGARVDREAEKVSHSGLWIMPLEDGQPTQLSATLQGQDRFPCWNHDGKSLLFVRVEGWQDAWWKSTNIYMISAEGGEARPITSASDGVVLSSVACSPDGMWVAFFSFDTVLSEGKAGPGGYSANCIKIKPVDGGPSRIVTQVNHRSGHEELCWSPDGKMIAYNANMGIWVVSANGGEPRRVETGFDESLVRNYVSWSPDGQTLAFVGSRLVDPELWLMEDFLPLVKR